MIYPKPRPASRGKRPNGPGKLRATFSDQPETHCGNADVGRLSSWYILSSLGFHVVLQDGGSYLAGSPILDRRALNVVGGRKFSITVPNPSRDNICIEEIIFDGKENNDNFIDSRISGQAESGFTICPRTLA